MIKNALFRPHLILPAAIPSREVISAEARNRAKIRKENLPAVMPKIDFEERAKKSIRFLVIQQKCVQKTSAVEMHDINQ